MQGSNNINNSGYESPKGSGSKRTFFDPEYLKNKTTSDKSSDKNNSTKTDIKQVPIPPLNLDSDSGSDYETPKKVNPQASVFKKKSTPDTPEQKKEKKDNKITPFPSFSDSGSNNEKMKEKNSEYNVFEQIIQEQIDNAGGDLFEGIDSEVHSDLPSNNGSGHFSDILSNKGSQNEKEIVGKLEFEEKKIEEGDKDKSTKPQSRQRSRTI